MSGVITGIGLVTPVGTSVDEVFDAVCAGRSGLRLPPDGHPVAVVCGCAEALLFDTFAETFNIALTLARGWADPTAASRPFDKRRNGFVLSESAAVFVIERPEFTDARGAAGYADILGWGASTDAHHPTTPRPDGDGAVRGMRKALADAGIGPADVGYINAHCAGTKLGDAAEAAGIRRVFAPAPGVHGPAVSSIKGITRHMLGASGAVEVAVSAAVLGRGPLPPTYNSG
jgi:3-oxoacyl-[acyl-carrier-protein] synthase II